MSSRQRIVVESSYALALGYAAYNFAYLEWAIVWLFETMRPGSIQSMSMDTAGKKSHRFSSEVTALRDSDLGKTRLVFLADTFSSLVKSRDALLHGNPYTYVDGEQRLQYTGRHGFKDWPVEEINRVAEEFQDAAGIAAAILHDGRLKAYHERKPSRQIHRRTTLPKEDQ